MLCALTLKAVADGVASPGQGRGGEHPYTWNINSFSAFDPLLTLLTPKMNEMLDLDLVPTYYYQRTYLRGGAMSHHTDRPSCQRSITMNLGYSHQWPIYIVNRETGKYTEFQAEPGDALLYMGKFKKQRAVFFRHLRGADQVADSVEMRRCSRS